MLLVLSSSCDDNDLTSASGKGSKGASGLSRLSSPFPCSTGGGSGSADARFSGSETCSSDYTYTPARGACYQLSGGYVVISFDRDETDNYHPREISIQFLVPEEGFTTDTYDIDAGEAIFRAKRTGKREEVYDSELCAVCGTGLYVTIDDISGTLGTSGSTLDISWNAAAGMTEDGTCDNDTVSSDGGWDDIPYM
jgi:hypothetical protein